MTTWYMIFCYGLFLFCGGFIAGNLYTARCVRLKLNKATHFIKPIMNTGTEFAKGVEMTFKVVLKEFGLEMRKDV